MRPIITVFIIGQGNAKSAAFENSYNTIIKLFEANHAIASLSNVAFLGRIWDFFKTRKRLESSVF
jgi:hypothetical protein